ncbi:MAG: hypothetical protein D6715_04655, partial [Calditrichaeota bacterium]
MTGFAETRGWVWLVMLLVWAGARAGQGPHTAPPDQGGIEVRAAVDRNTITIGDRITYTLTIVHPESLQVQQPGPGANLGQFEIKDYHIDEPRHENGQVVEQFRYVIS